MDALSAFLEQELVAPGPGLERVTYRLIGTASIRLKRGFYESRTDETPAAADPLNEWVAIRSAVDYLQSGT